MSRSGRKLEPPLLDALQTIRGEAQSAPEQARRAWRRIHDAFVELAGRAGRGLSDDREDAVSEALVKVMRGAAQLDATTEVGARSWLKRIYDHTLVDRVRQRRRRREQLDETRGETESFLDSLPAPVEPDPVDPSWLSALEDRFWDRVDEHIERDMRPHVRANARRQAEVAYARIVRQRSAEHIASLLEGTAPVEASKAEVRPHGRACRSGISRASVYQWVHRGRDRTLLPVARGWAKACDPDTVEGRFAAELAAVLEGHVRSDSGRARPERRKKRHGSSRTRSHTKPASIGAPAPGHEP
jgi:DNA-directed RNA polymerase specialized sigma24 family protein